MASSAHCYGCAEPTSRHCCRKASLRDGMLIHLHFYILVRLLLLLKKREREPVCPAIFANYTSTTEKRTLLLREQAL